jgi:hypothetical protein
MDILHFKIGLEQKNLQFCVNSLLTFSIIGISSSPFKIVRRDSKSLTAQIIQQTPIYTATEENKIK